MAYKRFETDQRVIVSVADLLQDRLENIKYKPGYGSRTITSDGGTSRVYSTVLFRLLELMIMDVIAGHVVYFDRNVKSMFYVDYKPASQEIISGKGIREDMKIPLVDFKATNYRMPIIVFDPGYKASTPCECFIPPYLYSMLIDEVNKGKKYPKSNKVFWKNKS
jgi:hypothetical protein